MRGRHSGVRDQAIGGILAFVREITPYLAIYALISWRTCDILGNRYRQQERKKGESRS
jgi:hypothetical protein